MFFVPAGAGCPGLAASLPVGRHAVEQHAIRGAGRSGLVDYNHVEPCDVRLVLPERLPDDTFYPVSAGCLPAVFFRDRQTESRGLPVILPAKYRKPFVAAARGFFEHAAEGRRIEKPVVFFEPVDRAASQLEKGLLPRGLRRELGAAFGTAALQNEAPGFRRHTGTKTVSACTLDLARLIRTFHGSGTWFFRKSLNDLRSGRAARVRRWSSGVNRRGHGSPAGPRRADSKADLAALRQTL